MIFLRRWLRLPTPIDLGWSKHNALGSREFTPYQEGKTWEDWKEYVRSRYPVRYFLAEVLPLWVKLWLIWPLGRVRAWVLDHVVPRRRHHFLDLRGIDPLSGYRHGYLDPCQVFWLAGWASLMRWYREDGGGVGHIDLNEWLDQESLQVKQYKEALALVYYWTVERIERNRRSDELYRVMDAIQTTLENQDRYEAAAERWLRHSQDSEALEEAMWLRLATIRGFLWD